MMDQYRYNTEHVGVREFPPFIRVGMEHDARKKLFSRAMKRVGRIRREYSTDQNLFNALYGEKKGKILNLLSETPQSAGMLIENSELSPSAVYHFLRFLRNQGTVEKKGRIYSLKEDDSDSLSLDEIVRVEDDPLLRRKYGISIKELELAYFLWNRYVEVAPREGGYARTYQSVYTLADAIHRWRTGRTDIPVWALDRLYELSGVDTMQSGDIVHYHLPPGIPVKPYYQGEYTLPVRVTGDLDKIFIQLMQKMSKNHLYTFPKRKKWLFEQLHYYFGEFDDSTSRIPSAIVEILKSYYRVKTLNRSSARIPSSLKSRWTNLNPLFRMEEQSSLLLHIISLSSRSNGGIEITSRSKPFLQDVSHLASTLGMGNLTVRKKHSRPHFRAYLSENKVKTLKRYAHLFQEFPELEIWLRIPLNRIAEKLVTTCVDQESVEKICREELSLFVESILKSLERRRNKRFSYTAQDYTQYTAEIAQHFWQEKLIPSPRRVEELVDAQQQEEILYYA
jgi:hypothetical protein